MSTPATKPRQHKRAARLFDTDRHGKPIEERPARMSKRDHMFEEFRRDQQTDGATERMTHEQQWEAFDEARFSRGVFIDPVDRAKWNHLDVYEEEAKSRTHLRPIRIDKQLSAAALDEIGQRITDAPFDWRRLPLIESYDVDQCLFIERPPDLTEADFTRLRGLAERTNLRVHLQEIDLAFVLCALSGEVQPSSATSSSSSTGAAVFVPTIDCIAVPNFTVLLWFTERILVLPLQAYVLENAAREMRDKAHAFSESEIHMWQQCMQVYATLQTDVATFLWHHGVRPQEDDAMADVPAAAAAETHTAMTTDG